MRFEEFSLSQIEENYRHLDTVLLTVGGLTWRPSHLPVGTTWYILRKLRDEVEMARGDRILTLPLQSIDTTFDDTAVVQLQKEAFSQIIHRYIHELTRHFQFRRLILLTDSLYKEQLVMQTLLTADSQLDMMSFIWWRDGQLQEALSSTSYKNVSKEFYPSGEWETSLMMALADHLVVRDPASLTRYLAQGSNAKLGSMMWGHLSQQLSEKVGQFIALA